MNRILLSLSLVAASLVLSGSASAANSLFGLNTSGTVYEVNKSNGALTTKASEEISDFSLGAMARRNNTLYYVATPSGSSENSVYTENLKTGALLRVDIDRSAEDDDVRALFLQGSKLYGVFYNGTAGTAGVYRITPSTGVTRLVLDLSAFDIEPLTGAITRAESYYLSSGSTRIEFYSEKAGSISPSPKLRDAL